MSSGWQVLDVRAADGDDAGGLYPRIAEDGRDVALEPGEQVLTEVDVRGLVVLAGTSTGPPTVLDQTYGRVRARLVLTDRRTIVMCERWNVPPFVAGGGGVVAVLTLGAAVAIRVAAWRSRRGLLLAGHVWHQWVSGVTYRSRAGRKTPAVLRVSVQVPNGDGTRLLMLSTRPDKGVDVRDLATRIAAVAAARRLELVPATESALRADLTALAEGSASPTSHTALPVYFLPRPWTVDPATSGPGDVPWTPA